jgi:hypothetical protein
MVTEWALDFCMTARQAQSIGSHRDCWSEESDCESVDVASAQADDLESWRDYETDHEENIQAKMLKMVVAIRSAADREP